MKRAWRHLLPRLGRQSPVSGSPLVRRLRRLSPLERLEEAYAFHRLYSAEHRIGKTGASRRWSEIWKHIVRHGFYEHTPEELVFGARVAWRNHARCIGRLFWESLTVFDCRASNDLDALVGQIGRHMTFALDDGGIRNTISIFPPIRGANVPPYIESAQLTQYAGYIRPDGSVMGDRRSVEATRISLALGWRPPAQPGAFDILPIILRDHHDRRVLAQMPDELVREIPITHPDCTAIGELGLRWYAVPVVSDMILTIGGIDYPCAPFNGFYMATEIASRNLADRNRYDSLPAVALALKLDQRRRPASFWQDTALTELNRAVVHSFTQAGVTIVDHHSASNLFMEFAARETGHGRRVSANWDWIVPPQASAACEVFHLPMQDLTAVPNFYRSGGDDGRYLMPYHGDRHLTPFWKRLHDERRAWKLRMRRA